MPEHFPPTSTIASRPAYLDGVDPRLRVVAVVVLSVVVAGAREAAAPAVALAVGLSGLAVSGLSLRSVLRRLLPLNVVMVLLAVVLPLAHQAPPRLPLGPLTLSQPGLLLAGMIALKGNAIMLGLLVLLGSTEATTLGHALSHLRVPEKLTQLLLFTVRYLDVLHRESLRLRAAMKVRGFRPRMDRHTYRSYGYLVGMLLVRSFDRSERIVAAMKCRGFRGRFYLLDHFAFSRRDVPFSVASVVILLALILMQWI